MSMKDLIFIISVTMIVTFVYVAAFIGIWMTVAERVGLR